MRESEKIFLTSSLQDEMDRKITSLEKAKLHYKESWTKALKELINGSCTFRVTH